MKEIQFWKPKEGDKLVFLEAPLSEASLSVGASYYQDEHGNLEMRELSLIDDGFVRGKSCCEVLGKAVEKIHLNAVFPHAPNANGVAFNPEVMTSIVSMSRTVYDDLVEKMQIIERVEGQKAAVKRFKSSLMSVRYGRKQTRFWWF